MRPTARSAAASVSALIFTMLLCSTQAQPLPRIGYVYPAGVQRGTNIQITIGGQYLDGATNLYFSGNGIHARVIEHLKPVGQGQFNDLREQVRELQKKQGAGKASSGTNSWTAADQQALAGIKKKIAVFQNRPLNAAIAESVIVELNVATNAEVSMGELRLMTTHGLSNPLAFCVGHLPEFSEKKIDLSGAGVDLKQLRNYPEQKAVPATELAIRIPATVNGQIMPGGRDRFRFTARKGQQLVLVARARQLIPYLPDAVPGWFQATLALYDAKGRELAYDDDFRFHPDPVLHYQIPADGEYVVEIRDAIYRGREDFVYRISIGELPFVTGIFPLGGRIGTNTEVELTGWNLPTHRSKQPGRDAGVTGLAMEDGDSILNQAPFIVGATPEKVDMEPNDLPQSAQKVNLPVTVNGRIAQPGDEDVFAIVGKAGEEIVAEVFARRLNSPLDSVLRLTDANGRQLASNDDHEDKGAGLTTHHADSLLRATLPAAGKYYLHIADSQGQGGSEFSYRLRIGAPEPDFELRVVPSSVTVRGGTSVPITIYALRKDGFTNEIALSLKSSIKGFELGGARVPANVDQIRVTLSAPPVQTNQPFTLALRGSAVVDGKVISRPVVPAEDMMQAFAYRHLVPAQEFKVLIASRYMQKTPARVLAEAPVKIPAGGKVKVQIAAPNRGYFKDRLELKLSEPPVGIALENVSFRPDGAELLLRTSRETSAGLEGNLIVGVFLAPDRSDTKNRKSNPIGCLPAIPFEVVEAQ